MREDRVAQGDGADPWLVLTAQSVEEELLTPVERVLLEVTLRATMADDARVGQQVAGARCRGQREFTNVGAFINLRVPGDLASDQVEHSSGAAMLNWRRPYPTPLMSVAFFEDGVLTMLELYTIETDVWHADACRSILSAGLDDVVIAPELSVG